MASIYCRAGEASPGDIRLFAVVDDGAKWYGPSNTIFLYAVEPPPRSLIGSLDLFLRDDGEAAPGDMRLYPVAGWNPRGYSGTDIILSDPLFLRGGGETPPEPPEPPAAISCYIPTFRRRRR